MSRLHVVTGKGGTGKTTVAAALALALAEEGRRTLLVEVEGRQGIAQLFETEPLPYEERKIAVAPGGGEVYALAVDAERALLDYLQMFYKLGGAGRALKKLGAIDFATTIAPGLRDVLLTGKVCEAVRRRERPQRGDRTDRTGGQRSGDSAHEPRRVYDAVVLDAPPTGRITRFLGVNDEVAGLARIGPIHNQAQAVMRVLKSAETAVHLVTLLEEMPVQETVDGVAELRASGLPVGCVVVNLLRPELLDPDLLDSELLAPAPNGPEPNDPAPHDPELLDPERSHREGTDLARVLSRAGLGGAEPGERAARLVAPLLTQAREHTERVALERRQRAELGRLDLPIHELGLLDEGVDLAGVYRLATQLRKQWATSR